MIRILWVFMLVTCGKLQAQIADFGKIDFRRADSVAIHYKGESLKNLPLLVYKLTHSFTSKVEQFRAIYTWVSTNIENDYEYYLINKRKREKLGFDSQEFANWNASFRSKVFKKLLKEKKTVCTGYAYLLKELAAMVDIECKIIDGYGRTIGANVGGKGVPNHSWNVVNLNNKWYLCDATWSSGGTNLQENKFIQDYNDGYFLSEPDLFVKNHYPLDTTWILMQNKPSLAEFLIAPLIYKHAFSYHLIPLKPHLKDLQVTKNELVSFVMKAPANINISDIYVELIEGTNVSVAKTDISFTKEGFLELKVKFERLGYYDVHIKVAANYIATYSVKVSKNKN